MFYAEKVKGIVLYLKQIESNPAAKAAYLNTPEVQNALHSFGDSFAHVQKDGTHYSPPLGHAVDSKTGHDPDNPSTHPDAYKNYVNTLFSVASEVTASARVNSSAITKMTNKVISTSEDKQANVLNSTIGSVIKATPTTSFTKSSVGDCGTGTGCSSKPIGSQVKSNIDSLYGVKK